MPRDKRLAKLREKDEIIGTFSVRKLIDDPDFVFQTYLEHTATHMSMGDITDFTKRLLNWATKNKGAVVGAIVGDYGYGKTSTAIHLWEQCENNGILAIPPFEWKRLMDIIDGCYAWVKFKVEKRKPGLLEKINDCYDEYREKSIMEFAKLEKISVSKVTKLVDSGKILLTSTPEDVIGFISGVSNIVESDSLDLKGPIVFIDELQVTMSSYTGAKRSRDEFMQDIFDLINPLTNLKGSFGLVFGIPISTEALINTHRRDIQHRLQNCNLYIRTENLYGRTFPANLWEKYSEIYDYEDIADQIISDDTLDSIGQIAFRHDLGAGPRTVVEAIKSAIDHYDKDAGIFTPINFVDKYLNKEIAFSAGEKFFSAVIEVLESNEVKGKKDAIDVIKLMAAFPLGCSDEKLKSYGLLDTMEKLRKKIYTQYFYKYPEGISLQKLGEVEVSVEHVFIEITKDFIQTYSESEFDWERSLNAFRNHVIGNRLITDGKASQIEGWKFDDSISNQYIGTFNSRYPYRRLMLKVIEGMDEIPESVDEFGIVFHFDPNCDVDSTGNIDFADDGKSIVYYTLNLFRIASDKLVIPFVEELGYPLEKITPLFMLALVDHLSSNEDKIPEDEKRTQMEPLIRRLLDFSIQLLLNEDLIDSAKIKGLSSVGLDSVKEVFLRMCSHKYPDYDTLAMTGSWEKDFQKYLSILGSKIISDSIGILRGNRNLETTNSEIYTLFGETHKQPVKGRTKNLSSVIELEMTGSKKESPATLRVKQHMAEEKFMEALRNSDKKIKRQGESVRALEKIEGFELLRKQGYVNEEIGVILSLLKTRKLIHFDDKKQYFVEVLESVEERSESVLSELSDLNRRVNILADFSDFNLEKYVAILSDLSEDIEKSTDVEELEDHQLQISNTKEELNRFSKIWQRKIVEQLAEVQIKVQHILNAGLSTELKDSPKGDVGWVSELAQSRVWLMDKFRKCVTEFNEINSRILGILDSVEGMQINDSAKLIEVYKLMQSVKAEYEGAVKKSNAAQGYLEGYIKWLSVLNLASAIYPDALVCETSYNHPRFKNKLENVFEEIVKQFKQGRLEVLADHEIFRGKIEKIRGSLDSWIKNRRDLFMEDKNSCEDNLKRIGVKKFNLHTNFDHFDPEASRDGLYLETSDKLLEYVASRESELSRYQVESMYLEIVLGQDLKELSGQIADTTESIKQIKSEISKENVGKDDWLDNFVTRSIDIFEAVNSIGSNLLGIIKPISPTDTENEIIKLLEDPRGVDLSAIIMSILKEGEKEFSFDELMKIIESLFKKNQIIVSIRKRR